ncbi:YcgJ family protein [Klebsiella aerogenes]|uniref:YcgJ family protein n=1 Tax=Klebsiella aerogenes TaxID=548 RepID=UPI002FFBF5D1
MSRRQSDDDGGRRLFYRQRRRGGAGWLFRGLLWVFPLAGLSGLWQVLFPLSRPQAGVVCDRAAGVCADRHGLSDALTARYLGPAAGDALRRYRTGGGQMQVWQFSSGLTCDAVARVCWRSPGRHETDAGVTGWLFRKTTAPPGRG